MLATKSYSKALLVEMPLLQVNKPKGSLDPGDGTKASGKVAGQQQSDCLKSRLTRGNQKGFCSILLSLQIKEIGR